MSREMFGALRPSKMVSVMCSTAAVIRPLSRLRSVPEFIEAPKSSAEPSFFFRKALAFVRRSSSFRFTSLGRSEIGLGSYGRGEGWCSYGVYTRRLSIR